MRALYRDALRLKKCAKSVSSYIPCDILVMYGMGASDRHQVALDHVAGGGILLTFDIGYWGRNPAGVYRKYRVSINGMHPPKFIMLGEDPGPRRWRQAKLEIIQSGNPDGPILLVGNGPKSNSAGANGWAAKTSRELRKVFPHKKVVYKPKPGRQNDPGVLSDSVTIANIDDVLTDISLVVCRHSNVAVDACRMGVPVVCEDGAAAAIYPQTLKTRHQQPDLSTRAEFLRRLAWWQWSPHEVGGGEFWTWMDKILDAGLLDTLSPCSDRQLSDFRESVENLRPIRQKLQQVGHRRTSRGRP